MTACVVFVNDIGGLGGIEMMLLVLARCLPRDQFTPVYLAPEPGAMAEQMRAIGVEVVIVPRALWWSTSFYVKGRKFLNPFALLYDLAVIGHYVLKLTAALRNVKGNVVHSSGMVSQITGGLSARLAGVPHVAQVQDIISNTPIRIIYQRLLEQITDQIVAISTAVGTGYSPRKTAIIPNIVDMSRWQATPDVRESLGIKPEQYLIGMIGRLTPWKGQHVFLAAAQQLAAADARYQFVIVGDDTVGGVSGYRDELEKLAAREPLAERVQFLGRRSDVLDIMAACDVIVHASIKPEPFGIVIVEAMAAGTPVIATALGGPLDIIENKSDGLLIPSNDPLALKDAIISLTTQPEWARTIAERARQKVLTHYSADSMTDRFAAIYRNLTDQ